MQDRSNPLQGRLRRGIVRVDGNRLLVRGDGTVRVHLLQQRSAQVAVEASVVRVDKDRLLVRGDGAVRVPLLHQRTAQAAVNYRASRP